MEKFTFSVRKGYHGIIAENDIPTKKEGYVLQVSTMKGYDGKICTSFNAGKLEGDIFSFTISKDFSSSIKHDAKRATEKAIVDCHDAALKQIDSIIEKFNDFYKINP